MCPNHRCRFCGQSRTHKMDCRLYRPSTSRVMQSDCAEGAACDHDMPPPMEIADPSWKRRCERCNYRWDDHVTPDLIVAGKCTGFIEPGAVVPPPAPDLLSTLIERQPALQACLQIQGSGYYSGDPSRGDLELGAALDLLFTTVGADLDLRAYATSLLRGGVGEPRRPVDPNGTYGLIYDLTAAIGQRLKRTKGGA